VVTRFFGMPSSAALLVMPFHGIWTTPNASLGRTLWHCTRRASSPAGHPLPCRMD